jgi:hypothetical protein
MRPSHYLMPARSVRFDDPNLVSCAGLASVMALAARCWLRALVSDQLRLTVKGRHTCRVKIVTWLQGW